jgi:hypothetical protein
MPIAPDTLRKPVQMPRFISAAVLAASLMLGSAPFAIGGESNSPAAQAVSPAAAQPAPATVVQAAPPAVVPAAPPAPAAVTTAPTAPAVAAAPSAPAAPAAGGITDDTARYLAGLQPPSGSPIAGLTREEGWQEHSRFFDHAFGELDRTQLAKVRAWSSAQLHQPQSTMFYMFSGPDFLYADAFFPAATTYVMAGLEPPGQIPDLLKMPRGSIGPSLRTVASSMHTVLNLSFFITHAMRTELQSGRLGGTTPILYIFLARAGKTVHEATLVNLDADGAEHPDSPGAKSAAHGVKIIFSGRDGRMQTLYYFSTNLANDGFATSGFQPFLERLAPGDSFIKSASYLLHGGNFTKVRDFLIAHSATILEDDSGIPLAYFDRQKWQLKPFGHYLQPLGIFPGTYQPKLQELFQKTASPMDFGVGYRWRPHESNLLLAVRSGVAATGTAGAAGPR